MDLGPITTKSDPSHGQPIIDVMKDGSAIQVASSLGAANFDIHFVPTEMFNRPIGMFAATFAIKYCSHAVYSISESSYVKIAMVRPIPIMKKCPGTRYAFDRFHIEFQIVVGPGGITENQCRRPVARCLDQFLSLNSP